ncbi:hypothetical protein DV113_001811 [Geotrichum candidum]|nr:hypothetical protein DV113_001811 [Geotrichum candidum]
MTDEEDTLLSSYPFNSNSTATYLNMSQQHHQQPFQGYPSYSKSNSIQLYMPPPFDQQQQHQQHGILPPPTLANVNYTTATPHHHHHLSNSSSPLPMHPQYSYSPTGQHFPSTAGYLKESPLQPRAAPSLFMDTAVTQYTPTNAFTTANSPATTPISNASRANSSNTNNNNNNAIAAAAAAAVAAASYTPFGYVPTAASTVPVNSPRTKTHQRRRTGSKRSVEEMLLESTIPTNTTLNDPIPPPRPGPSVGLLSMPLPSQPMPLPGAPGTVMPNTPPTLPLSIPEPPLALAPPINPNVMKSDPQPRPKKKSKYTPEQDQIILTMKKNGLPWTDISKAAQCGNHIAARNRYQVLIGQQGGGAVVWDSEDTHTFKRMLEDGERAKWNFIANELSRIRSKKATPMACQRKVKDLFEQNPALFGIVLNNGEAGM